MPASKSDENYAWYADGIFGGVTRTDHPVDGSEVFATFSAARAGLVAHMRSMADQYKMAANDARKLRKPDVEANPMRKG